MSKVNIFYIISLMILVVLIGIIAFQSVTADINYSTVTRESLLQTNDGYIVEFDIINHEGEDMNYTIDVLTGDTRYTDDILVLAGRIFTYGHIVYPDRIGDGDVIFTIYKEGEDTPFEEITYHLK